MGKKSKRRTGKPSQQKERQDVNNNGTRNSIIPAAPSATALAAQSRDALRQYSTDTVLSIDEGKGAFDEFMLWSLSDEADLNPKKFARQASGIAKLLIPCEISIKPLLERRCQSLTQIELKAKEYEYQETYQILSNGIKFESPKYKDEFKKEWREVLSRIDWENSMKTPMHLVLYDSFQEVLSKWSNSSKASLDDDSIFASRSRQEFDELCSRMLKNMIRNEPKMMNDKLFQKYSLHPTARGEEYLGKGIVYAHKLLVSVLTLYEELHRCWKCNRLHGKGNETKALICEGCKVVVCCSKECQVEHWKEGNHKKLCRSTDDIWSAYESRKKRVGRAIRKGRIFTKPISINGIERECFLRPCEFLDYYVCTLSPPSNNEARFASMDLYYENIARLACGGKHILFGDQTISSQLEEKIRTGFEDVISEFNPETVKEEEISAMEKIVEMIQFKESYLTNHDLRRSSLPVDKFITLYICYGSFDLSKQIVGGNLDKFEIETNLLRQLKRGHDVIMDP
ncbi:predicted protein [Chaetoceros tenuissimus]|uniref:MYND-type domain-containing protein n=1 Tax=Chaetoceros tenuissimus TaxID=426638 RepID=A0AAD3H2M6_9STRA|nr:predicted protein [Chaetoceros tenuissimus]